MQETITRCSICKSEDCDGQEYIVRIPPIQGVEGHDEIHCSSTLNVDNGYHKITVSHGHYAWCEFWRRR